MKLQFTLLDNAKDSLAHAVDHLTKAKPTTGDYKRVILDLSHAIELILKERLRKIHPAFVLRNIDKFRFNKITDSQTVGSEEAIARLINLEGTDLPDSLPITIKTCRQLRNKIEHFEFDIDSKEARAIIGRLLSSIFNFSKVHLDHDFESDFRKDTRWKELIEIYEFYEEHSKLIADNLSKENRHIWPCPSCNANTFDVDLELCKFCGHYESVIECEACHELYFESEIEVVSGCEEDYGDYDFTICRDCLKAEQDEAEMREM